MLQFSPFPSPIKTGKDNLNKKSGKFPLFAKVYSSPEAIFVCHKILPSVCKQAWLS